MFAFLRIPTTHSKVRCPRQITRKNHRGRLFQRGRSSARLREQLWEYFEVRFRAEKYGVPYFLAESEAQQSDPRKEALGARARARRFPGRLRVKLRSGVLIPGQPGRWEPYGFSVTTSPRLSNRLFIHSATARAQPASSLMSGQGTPPTAPWLPTNDLVS
jgi:hypothetical protein